MNAVLRFAPGDFPLIQLARNAVVDWIFRFEFREFRIDFTQNPQRILYSFARRAYPPVVKRAHALIQVFAAFVGRKVQPLAQAAQDRGLIIFVLNKLVRLDQDFERFLHGIRGPVNETATRYYADSLKRDVELGEIRQ